VREKRSNRRKKFPKRTNNPSHGLQSASLQAMHGGTALPEAPDLMLDLVLMSYRFVVLSVQNDSPKSNKKKNNQELTHYSRDGTQSVRYPRVKHTAAKSHTLQSSKADSLDPKGSLENLCLMEGSEAKSTSKNVLAPIV